MAAATAVGHERVALVGTSFGLRSRSRPPCAIPAGWSGWSSSARPPTRARGPCRASTCAGSAGAPDEHLSVLPVMARDLADVGPRRAAELLRLMPADRLEDRLGGVTAPALAVRGGRDRVVPQRWAAEVARLLPAGRLAVLPGYAHMPHWSGALAVAALLRPFLAG